MNSNEEYKKRDIQSIYDECNYSFIFSCLMAFNTGLTANFLIFLPYLLTPYKKTREKT